MKIQKYKMISMVVSRVARKISESTYYHFPFHLPRTILIYRSLNHSLLTLSNIRRKEMLHVFKGRRPHYRKNLWDMTPIAPLGKDIAL